jgi:hypothetical protein
MRIYIFRASKKIANSKVSVGAMLVNQGKVNKSIKWFSDAFNLDETVVAAHVNKSTGKLLISFLIIVPTCI